MEKTLTKSNILKAKRAELGFSQTDVANALDVTLVTYRFKENGIKDFSQSELYQLRKKLKLSDEEVLYIFLGE